MGEAKRRKAADPTWGRPTRGLIVSPPMEIEGTRLHLKQSWLDKQELRFGLLFWDKLVWPSSRAIYIASDSDAQFLEQAGILTRPEYTFDGDVAEGIAKGYIQAFKDLEQKNPGLSSIAQGPNSLMLRDGLLVPNAGIGLELHRAIPVPDKDVPLHEMLEFKLKRRDELQKLREEIDSFVATISASSDSHEALRSAISRIDQSCSDAIKVGHEWQFPIRMSNFKASLELRPFQTAGGALTAYLANSSLSITSALLATISGALLATSPALKLTPDFGWQGIKRRLGPYRYVFQFHKELF